jgi:hypothetical protein
MDTVLNPVNDEVFKIFKTLPSSQGELFLSRAAAHLKGVKNATRATVRDFYKIWIDAVTRDNRDRLALGEDY